MSAHGIAAGIDHDGAITADNLIAGDFPRVSRIVTVTAQGLRPRNMPGSMVTGALPVGMLLGQGVDGRYRQSYFIANDGSQLPSAVLAQSIDVSSGDVQAMVYLSGEFNTALLSWGQGHNLASVTEALRHHSIFIRTNQS